MKAKLTICMVLLPIFAESTAASANTQEVESIRSERTLDVAVSLSLFAPQGVLGLELEQRKLLGPLSLAGGVGLSLDGAEVYLMPRFRWRHRWLALGTGLGTSYGSYNTDFIGIGGGTEVSAAISLVGELFLEARGDRLFARAFTGVGLVAAGEKCEESNGGDETVPCEARGQERMFGGLSIGLSF